MEEVAIQFGQSLDNDEFQITERLLDQNCKYIIEDEVLIGPESICQSYEQNMIAGRKKLDVLEWGQSRIEAINSSEFYVHFTDYLTHKGEKYTHRCKQIVHVNSNKQIDLIQHVHNQEEQEKLNSYYKRVGLKE